MEKRLNTAAILCLAGGILVLLNILLIAMSSAPITVSNYSESVDVAMTDSAPLWWRMSFGIRGFTDGTNLAMGLIIAAIMIYCSLSLYLKPRNVQLLAPLIIVFSALTLLFGGGFIIGSVLSFIGAAVAYETPRALSETLIGKMLSSMKASSKAFRDFMKDTSVRHAAMVILFVNLLSGIGNGIFTYNATNIIGATNAKIPFEILFTGRLNLDAAIVQTPIILMGLGIFKWALLSLILFFVGVNVFGEKATLASVAACVGFAYAPISLQLFTAFVFTSKPYLTYWSLTVFLLTNLWMIIILIAGMKLILNVSFTKSAATVASCGAIYTLINYLIFTQVSIPYFTKFQIEPPAMMLLIASLFIAAPIYFMGKKSSS